MKKMILSMLGCIATGIVSAQTGVEESVTDPVAVDRLNYVLDVDAKSAVVVEGDYANEITIPASITVDEVLYSVTAIGENAFSKDPVTVVTIPNSVETIGTAAFRQCN